METRDKLIEQLNLLLADYQVYYQNLRGFHWNIQGKHFFELHGKFEELYRDSAEKIDEVAERILTIDGKPLHTYEDYLNSSDIKSAKDVYSAEGTVHHIVDGLSLLIAAEEKAKSEAEKVGDDATADLMTQFVEQQEKTKWMFKAWLK
ncbi:MAG: DNA starvation/stationary phase protection protein [Bacteroidota bacterium]